MISKETAIRNMVIQIPKIQHVCIQIDYALIRKLGEIGVIDVSGRLLNENEDYEILHTELASHYNVDPSKITNIELSMPKSTICFDLEI